MKDLSMTKASRAKELRENTNHVFLKFNSIYYLCILLGVFFQYVHSNEFTTLKICVFLATLIAFGVQLAGFYMYRKKGTYGIFSLCLGCAYFSAINLMTYGSEVMLIFIPFCTLSILVTEKNMMVLLNIVWASNALARIIMLLMVQKVTVLQIRNFLWISFVCLMFSTASYMVNRLVGVYYATVINDLFYENKKHQKLYELSKVDSTTELLNRIAYNEYVDNFDHDKQSLCCVYIDVNGLHEYNNSYGHEAGDKMLSTVGIGIKQCFKNCMHYRIGGDEFVVICENQEFNQVLNQLKLFRNEMKKKKIHVATGLEWRDENIHLDEIIKAADSKMYEDKEQFYKEHEEEDRKRSIYV